MSTVKTDNAHYTNIANAIRNKNGTATQYKPSEMPDAINNIQTSITPTISVSSGGLITATSGDKSTTKQLATQAAKTITPSTSSQTAVSSGKYTTGAITVAGDSNLIASNIVSGKTIFGVSGTASTTQSAPTISVSSSGLVTATADGKSNSVYLSSSYDSDFVASNIVSGKTIFGVTGTASTARCVIMRSEFTPSVDAEAYTVTFDLSSYDISTSSSINVISLQIGCNYFLSASNYVQEMIIGDTTASVSSNVGAGEWDLRDSVLTSSYISNNKLLTTVYVSNDSRLSFYFARNKTYSASVCVQVS